MPAVPQSPKVDGAQDCSCQLKGKASTWRPTCQGTFYKCELSPSGICQADNLQAYSQLIFKTKLLSRQCLIMGFVPIIFSPCVPLFPHLHFFQWDLEEKQSSFERPRRKWSKVRIQHVLCGVLHAHSSPWWQQFPRPSEKDSWRTEDPPEQQPWDASGCYQKVKPATPYRHKSITFSDVWAICSQS